MAGSAAERIAAATEASQCFLDIISRTGIPLKVLSDRGSLFLSKLMKGLYERLGIDPIATSPYRPQSNGVVERFHGTIKPMLAKARDSDVNWAEFLLLALFAIRQVPNRTTGFSPHQLVYGRDVIGPLDVLHAGWTDKNFDSIDVEEWLLSLNDKLTLIHDLAVSEEAKNVESRVVSFNRGKSDRCLKVGTQVLMRVPGIHGTLQAAWEGPYNVIDRVSRVTYRVSKGDGHPVRLAHLNNLKEYQERCKMVNAVTLVAEDQGISEELLVNKAVLSKDKCPNYNESGLKLVLSGLDKYFSAKPGLCSVGVCDIVLKDGASVVNLPPRQIPGGIREAVRAEIDKLVSKGVIVESSLSGLVR